MFLLNNTEIDPDAAESQPILAEAYKLKQRLGCLCREPYPEMYLARVNGQLIIKKMPGSGVLHSPDCASYDPPPELSGLGEVLGTAIKEDAEEGKTLLKFDFALKKVGGRTAPEPSGTPPDSIKSDSRKLTLLATLHYLWDQAGFNRWSPRMAGKRNWGVVRYHLHQAASDKATKDTDLHELLYLPDSWRPDRQEEQANGRRLFSKRFQVSKGPQPMFLVLGEFFKLEEARFGYRLVLKHMLDSPLYLEEKMATRIQKRFALEFELANTVADGHLVVLATVGVSPAGAWQLGEITMMPVDHNWIPFSSQDDLVLLQKLVSDHRRFIKGLRYNLSDKKPLATVLLQDTKPKPTAIYVRSGGENEETLLAELIDGSELDSWIWDSGDEGLDGLPRRSTGSARVAMVVVFGWEAGISEAVLRCPPESLKYRAPQEMNIIRLILEKVNRHD